MITKKANFAIIIVTLSLVGVWPSPSTVPSGTNWFRPAATRPDDDGLYRVPKATCGLKRG